ncbi:methyl-accepting chemotaxis protein [Lederbergia lenta]|uniref:Methyl-accepting chemotaxis protein n=1 Tax=Lederbergia lenta TaxID=1467 RepID=A0A2X4ZDH9_LEDLE|nr:methyl-accepting chemotaxis protein [Lederbergia lenta]MEC2323056.1 methyl-accepting chemotaxis protein [Lederbergia lenta]SQI62605.1 methyl-accepting chemotaxis protein [Lederbergia lenta]
MKKFNVSLKNKLILSFISILLIPSITIAIFSYKSSEKNIDIQMLEATQKNVEIINQTVDQFMLAQMENVDYLSNMMEPNKIDKNSDPATRKLLDTIQGSKADVEQTYIGTETGQFMNSPTSFKNPPDYDPRQRPWYQEAMKSRGEVIITDPYVSQSSQQVVVTLAKATADGKGVVAVNLKLESLTEMISKVSIGEEGYLFLLDKNNHYISHPTGEAGEEAPSTLVEKLGSSNSDSFTYDIDGDQKKLSFTTSEPTGWKIVGTMFQDEVDQAVKPILNTTLIVIIASLILGGISIWLIIVSIIKPINTLVSAADQMSQGDLSVQINLQSKDELGRLAQAFNHMRANLSDIISKVHEKSSNLAASSEQLNASTEENTSATEQISSSIQEVAAGMEMQTSRIEESSIMAGDMSKSIQYIVTSSNGVSQTAVNATSAVEEGNKAIETTVAQMEFIKQTVNKLSGNIEVLDNHSQEISKIVDVITNIAEQTNLLALNAAIEAARAGESGKGFAVVADEVRKLAEQSAQSTEQIRKMIGSIQQETSVAVKSMESGTTEVDRGIEVVSHAGESFTAITGFVNTISEQIAQVTSEIEGISAGTEQFIGTFEEVSKVADSTAGGAQNVSASTQEQLASMEEIRSAAMSLSEIAEELQGLVQQFKL